jgi:hypothetical protein
MTRVGPDDRIKLNHQRVNGNPGAILISSSPSLTYIDLDEFFSFFKLSKYQMGPVYQRVTRAG